MQDFVNILEQVNEKKEILNIEVDLGAETKLIRVY